ncbi:MAG TPA: hypothetical protein VJ691_08195 [Vicinamibacterales bacterium]|nr:hypothetical protein [Vicinamibacterales bacterium]
MAPGSRLLAFASNWFDEPTVARVFVPLVADWQREWHTARPMRRPLIRFRGVAAFAVATLVSYPRVLATPPPPGITGRVIGRVAIFVSIGALVLSSPFVIDSTFAPVLPLLLFATIPSGIALSFPFAMLTAVDVIRREPNLKPYVARVIAVRLAAAAVVFMAFGHGWLVPAANQQFRVLATPAGVPAPTPGFRELTTSELLSDSAFPSPAVRYSRAGAIRIELNNRAVLAVLPAVFVWLRWIAHDVRKRRRYWPLPAIVMVVIAIVGFFASYWSGALAERAWGLAPGTGLWLPIVVATLIGVTQQWLSSRRRHTA